MPRHIRRMLSPIIARKHYVHSTNTVIAAGAIQSNVLVSGVVAPATGNSFSVIEGCAVKAVYIERWIKSNATAGGSTQFTMIIEKLPSNAPSVTFAQIANLGAYTNKKNILYSTQGVIGDLTTNSLALIRQFVLIPKGKQRFGLNDRLTVSIAAVGLAMQSCGIATYKEYQ